MEREFKTVIKRAPAKQSSDHGLPVRRRGPVVVGPSLWARRCGGRRGSSRGIHRFHAADGCEGPSSSLGQASSTVVEKDVATVREIDHFVRWRRSLCAITAIIPPLAELQARLEHTEHDRYTWSEQTAAAFQPPHVHAPSLIRRISFEDHWRGRALDTRAQRLMRREERAYFLYLMLNFSRIFCN